MWQVDHLADGRRRHQFGGWNDIEIDKEVMSTKDSTGEIDVGTKVEKGTSCSTNLT